MNVQTRHTLMLVLCSMIWGLAFTAQSMGAGLGAYTFLAGRSWLGAAFLVPVIAVFDGIRKKQGESHGGPKTTADKKTLAAGALCCGTVLFFASAAQQLAITINPSTAKASFITAMYVVLVPIAGRLLFRRRCGAQIWFCVLLTVAGLYLLCMQNGFGGLESSDLLLMVCAVLFTFQILAVDRYSPLVDGMRLSCLQFVVVALWSTAAMFLFETPTWADLLANAGPIVFCGVFSSGIAYTLQIVGQKNLNPTLASIAMCCESVFGALGGWLILHQRLSGREIVGCLLIFVAVVLAQLPLGALLRRKKARPAEENV